MQISAGIEALNGGSSERLASVQNHVSVPGGSLFSRPSNELGELLSSLALLQEGNPADAAMPQDWERAVETVDARDPTDFGDGLKLS
jgi:hypothetical protein